MAGQEAAFCVAPSGPAHRPRGQSLMGAVTWPLGVPTGVHLLWPCLPWGSHTPLSWEGRGPGGPSSLLPRACHPSHSGTRPQNKPFQGCQSEAQAGPPHPAPAPPRPQRLTRAALTLTAGLCPPAGPPLTRHLSADTARSAPL